MASIRRWLLAGLLVLVPLAITLWVLDWIVGTLDQTLLILPGSWHPDKLLGFHIPGFGVLLTLLIVLLMGAVASNFFGKKLVRWGNSFLSRIPIVRSIYSSVKQVSDTVFQKTAMPFARLLLVQWPREGVWTIGFLTGVPGGDVVNHLPGEYLSVYVPTTPNPTGGYFVMLKKSDCIELRMSVDEALDLCDFDGRRGSRQNGNPAPDPTPLNSETANPAREALKVRVFLWPSFPKCVPTIAVW
jgi:uncharacterized membrane protein